jgi:hypothetical protein
VPTSTENSETEETSAGNAKATFSETISSFFSNLAGYSKENDDSVNNEDESESKDDNYGFSSNPENPCSGQISDLGTCDVDSDI